MLQILKYIFRNEGLTFTANLLCSEEELTILDIPDDLVHRLHAERRLYDLEDHIQTSSGTASGTVPIVGPADEPETQLAPVDTINIEIGEEYTEVYDRYSYNDD